MKPYLIIGLILTVAIAVSGEEQAPVFPSEVVTALQPILPTGWTVRSDSGSIVLTRNEPITILNPISLPAMDRDKLLREFGRRSDYIIILVFRERMTDAQFADLKAKRDQALRKIDDDSQINGKTKYGMLNQENDSHPLPTFYNARFSIYLHRTDPPPLQVYPQSAADERTKILEALSRLMKNYEF